MSLKKRLGYNWKARQQRPTRKKHGSEGNSVAVELDQSVCGGRERESDLKSPLDTNVEVVLPKRSKLSDEEIPNTVKRRKLNSKQRKRLLKVVEAKEKKAKVIPIKAHHTWKKESVFCENFF